VVSSALVGFAVMYFALGPAHVTNFLGFAFPAYASFKAIESPEKDDDTQWLTYWVVFSAFSLLETFSDVLAESFPTYYAFKFAFLIWLSAPVTRGAEFLYSNFIRPFLLENEKSIDRRLAQAEEAATEVAEVTQEIAHEKAGDIIDEVKGMAQDGFEQVEKPDGE
jgi:receptor expression-enhancing protein 5/6